MKTILITGAAGFVGNELVKSIDRSKYNLITVDLIGNVDILGDLSRSDFVDSLPLVDVVIHCAAVQYVSQSLPIVFRESYFEKNNVKSTEYLLEKYKNISQFIHIGTSMLYEQNSNGFYDVNSPYANQGVYSSSKIQCQKLVDKYNNTSTIIPCIIGGRGRGGLFQGFVKTISKYNVAIIPGKGKLQISVVHVKDLISLINLVLEKRVFGKFNAACHDALSIDDWVNIISSKINGPVKTVKKIKLPLMLAKIISLFSFRRILAKEQILMLTFPHVIDITTSKSIGWNPIYSSEDVISDITSSLIEV